MYPQAIKAPLGSYNQIRPLTDELSEIRFIAPQALVEKIEEIRGMLAHSHPGASLAELFDVLASEFRAKHHPEDERSGLMRERK